MLKARFLANCDLWHLVDFMKGCNVAFARQYVTAQPTAFWRWPATRAKSHSHMIVTYFATFVKYFLTIFPSFLFFILSFFTWQGCHEYGIMVMERGFWATRDFCPSLNYTILMQALSSVFLLFLLKWFLFMQLFFIILLDNVV